MHSNVEENTMNKVAGFLLSLLCVAGLACTTYADPPAHARGAEKGHKNEAKPGKSSKSSKGNKHDAGIDANELLSSSITAVTARELARQGGWTGYEPLPPGIAKNLARGKPLPPGIAKKAVPGSMLKKLPYYPGYNWYAAGKDLILLSATGLVIADVLHNVFD